jgi:hypothetical protein
MKLIQSVAEQIHARALEVVSRYKRTEAELIEVLQLAEKHQVHELRGHTSLYSYAVSELGLGEHAAYNLITVSRKATQVPELKTQLELGAITLSKARRISAVMTSENQSEWLEKAATLTSRELEKEIARVRPKEATPERATYVSENQIKLEFGLSEEVFSRLKRSQDILCQSRKKHVSFEEALDIVNSEFLERHDPIEKASRHQSRQEVRSHQNQNASIDQNETIEKIGAKAESQTSPNENESKAEIQQQFAKQQVLGPALAKKLTPATRQALTSKPALVTRREASRRKALPAHVRHQVNFRDKRRCQHVLPNGLRCRQSRWVEIHHKIPVHQGGKDIPENLITLCSAHHRVVHDVKNVTSTRQATCSVLVQC